MGWHHLLLLPLKLLLYLRANLEGSQCLPSELCLAGENGRESDSGEVKRHRQAAVTASGMAAATQSATAAAMAMGDGNRQWQWTTVMGDGNGNGDGDVGGG